MVTEYAGGVVSKFQQKLEYEDLAKADFCHEVKEFVDAIAYLSDDAAQAKRAIDAMYHAAKEEDRPEISNLHPGVDNLFAELDNARDEALELLKVVGCPAYEGY